MSLAKEELDRIIDKYRDRKGFLIPLMQDMQNAEGYLSRDSMRYITERLNVKVAEIYGVATFYSMFRLKPLGKHIIRVCKGTACHVSGATTIGQAVRTALNITEQEDQTSDGMFTYLEVACLGCCSLAPVMMIDNTTYAKLTSEKVSSIIQAFNK